MYHMLYSIDTYFPLMNYVWLGKFIIVWAGLYFCSSSRRGKSLLVEFTCVEIYRFSNRLYFITSKFTHSYIGFSWEDSTFWCMLSLLFHRRIFCWWYLLGFSFTESVLTSNFSQQINQVFPQIHQVWFGRFNIILGVFELKFSSQKSLLVLLTWVELYRIGTNKSDKLSLVWRIHYYLGWIAFRVNLSSVKSLLLVFT